MQVDNKRPNTEKTNLVCTVESKRLKMTSSESVSPEKKTTREHGENEKTIVDATHNVDDDKASEEALEELFKKIKNCANLGKKYPDIVNKYQEAYKFVERTVKEDIQELKKEVETNHEIDIKNDTVSKFIEGIKRSKRLLEEQKAINNKSLKKK